MSWRLDSRDFVTERIHNAPQTKAHLLLLVYCLNIIWHLATFMGAQIHLCNIGGDSLCSVYKNIDSFSCIFHSTHGSSSQSYFLFHTYESHSVKVANGDCIHVVETSWGTKISQMVECWLCLALFPLFLEMRCAKNCLVWIGLEMRT